MHVLLFLSHPLALLAVTGLESVCPSITIVLPSASRSSHSLCTTVLLCFMGLEHACPSISFTSTRATSINKAGACVSHQYSCASQSSHLAPTDFTVSHWLLSLQLSTVVRSLRARASVQPCQNLATPIQKSLACQSCLKLPATWNPVSSGIVNTVGTLLVMLVFQSHL